MKRGRHQSSCKDGKKTIKKIESIEGVSGVIIGYSFGGKSIGTSGAAGSVKFQRVTEGGVKAVLQTSKGVQELFVKTELGKEQAVKRELEKVFKTS